MKLLKEETIKINDADVTVRTSDGFTLIDMTTYRVLLYGALGVPVDEDGFFQPSIKVRSRLFKLLPVLTNTAKVDGDLGIPWPPPETEEGMKEFYTQFAQNIDAIQFEEWQAAVERVNVPSVKAETQQD